MNIGKFRHLRTKYELNLILFCFIDLYNHGFYEFTSHRRRLLPSVYGDSCSWQGLR
jgi:hypothetical protein